MQSADLFGNDDPAAAAEYANVLAAALAQHVHHVLEILHVPALIGTHSDAVHVLLQCRTHHLLHGPVVTKMNDLGAGRLQDAAHDVDGGVVPVEEAGGGDESFPKRSAICTTTG